MKFKLAFHPLARIDLVEASLWHELQEPGLGNRLETEAQEVFRKLMRGALLYGIRFDDIRRANLPSFQYGVFYFLLDDTAVILGVLHGARDSETELQQRRQTYG